MTSINLRGRKLRYRRITSNEGDVVVETRPVRLHAILGTAPSGGTLLVYDNDEASGDLVFRHLNNLFGWTFRFYGVRLNNGLSYNYTGNGAGIIIYE